MQYQTVAELSAGAFEQIVDRVNSLLERKALDLGTEVDAVLGGAPKPSFKLSNLLPEFEKIEAVTLKQMSDNQVRKWRNPKKRALDNLISVVTDKDIRTVKRADGVEFRIWLQNRVLAEEINIGTANKDIGHVSKMWSAVDLNLQLGLPDVFTKLRLSGEIKAQRAAFEADYVQKVILATGALDDLNPEARRLVYVIADTGMRLSEAANLLPEHIRLDAPVPHVQIRAVGRKLKTDHSERDIPLVGVALAAMRLQPKGFPRYHDKADSLSALVNDCFVAKKLLPTSKHSLYSLRHTFEDRLTAVEAPEKVVASLMGHKWHRPKYGSGPTLEQKQRHMLKIAFIPPAHL
ncbi:tyrosine-type recombinase/integrase [Aminobacter sp. MDW-2]|nr:tyrosine-type recombinase/integrase [Aminobacter sp. MDW-2]QNH36967.1 tyrosine-type recombinase/integrase [Aminobacter sp. MDW-2]